MLQVLAASVMDTLYAAVPAAPAKDGQGETLADAGSAASSVGSSQAPTVSTSKASFADLPHASQRACLFEVEVVLTPSGTKITPSLAQYGVWLFYHCLRNH